MSTDVPPPLTASLQVAKQWTRERADTGVDCPCCAQFVRVYRRTIHRTIAKALVRMRALERSTGQRWVHVASAISPACELGKARYWGLVEEETARRPDGGRAGFWSLTDSGRDFVDGRLRLPKHARIYNGVCLGHDGPLVGIRDCLPVGFDYAALMAR